MCQKWPRTVHEGWINPIAPVQCQYDLTKPFWFYMNYMISIGFSSACPKVINGFEGIHQCMFHHSIRHGHGCLKRKTVSNGAVLQQPTNNVERYQKDTLQTCALYACRSTVEVLLVVTVLYKININIFTVYIYRHTCIHLHGPWIVNGIIPLHIKLHPSVMKSWKYFSTLPSSNLAPLANNKNLGTNTLVTAGS